MTHKPEKPPTPLPQYRGTNQNSEESDLDHYLGTPDEESEKKRNNNYCEDEIVVFVFRKCI